MPNEPSTEEKMRELLGPPVDVSDAVLQECVAKGDFSELAFEIYKETGALVAVCGHLFESEDPEKGKFARNQAICAGLLIRIAKFMIAVAQLASSARREDVVMALNRSIVESAINLRFLLHKNEERFFDQFARFSLGPERELYDIIQANIKQRGGDVWPIEQRMLSSIDRVCRLTGVKIEDVDRKYGDWAGGLRERAKAVGDEALYSTQRIASHAVHGTWADLVLHHLEEKDGGYVPDPSWSDVDARLMLPVCLVCSEAAQEYGAHFFGKHNEGKQILERTGNLQQRIRTVDAADEAWRTKKKDKGKATD
jgi:hypothetical protein